MMKDIRVLGHDSEFSVKADRQQMPPWGIFGGLPGMSGRIVKNPGLPSEQVIDSKQSGVVLEADGILRCRMPGGGGYGDPLERQRDLVIRDLKEGYITLESALRDYGLKEEDLQGNGF